MPLKRLLVALALFTLGLLPASQAQAADTTTVRLVSEQSSIPLEGTALFTVEVMNAPSDAVIALDVYLPVDGDRRAVDAAFDGVVRGQQFFPGIRLPVSTAVGSDHRAELIVATSKDGQYGTFTLKSPGLYPVLISVRQGNQTLAQLTTFLTRLDPSSRAVDVAVVLPVDQPPTQQTDGRRMISEVTRRQLETIDRLGVLAPDFPFTLSIRPDIVEALLLGDASDRALADRLAVMARRGETINDSAIDIDPSHADAEGLGSVYGVQVEHGQRILSTLLAGSSGPMLADSGLRFLSRPVSPDGLEMMRRSGANALVAAPSLVKPAATPVMTGPVEIDGNTNQPGQALVIGNADFEDLLTSYEPATTVPRFLAQLESLLPATNTPPTGVALIAPPDWTAPVGGPLDQFIADLPYHAALHPVPIRQYLSDTTPMRDASASPLRRSLGTPGPPIATDIGRDVALVELDIAALSSVSTTLLPDPTPFLNAARSTALTKHQRDAYLTAAKAPLARLRTAIEPIPHQEISVSSGNVFAPLRISTALTDPVKVRLHFSTDGGKATFADNDRVVTLTDGSYQGSIDMMAREGQYVVDVTASPPDGGEALASGTITVKAFAFGGFGIALTASAGLVLITWWVSNARRSRRRKQALVESKRHPSTVATG